MLGPILLFFIFATLSSGFASFDSFFRQISLNSGLGICNLKAMFLGWKKDNTGNYISHFVYGASESTFAASTLC